MERREQNLFAWQFAQYPRGHRDRRNLVLHLVTVPLFMAGTAALALGLRWPLLFAVGPALMILVVVIQGRGHRLEVAPPLPFNGPFDVVARLFVEQWVTFPRFVLSGGFARAWRGEAPIPSVPSSTTTTAS